MADTTFNDDETSVGEDWLNPVNRKTYGFTSVSHLKTIQGLFDGQQVELAGYYTTGDGGGGQLYWDATSTETADDGMIFQVTGVTTGRWKRPDIPKLYSEQYGVIGSGDETTQLLALFAVSARKKLIMKGNVTFTSSDSLVQEQYCTLDLNGSTLKFTTTASENNLDMRDGCRLWNGTVENAGTAITGHGGNQCPIIIGDYGPGTGYKNITIDKISIKTARTGGNGMFITGDTKNIKISNIEFPTSTTLGAGIAVHWGGATDETLGTYHPRNIKISNITGDTINTGMTALGHALVSLSGCFNIDVKNIDAENVKNIVFFYSGDFSDQYAGDLQGKISYGVTVKNVNARTITGEPVRILGEPLTSGDTLDWPIEFKNVHVEGTATNGFALAHCNGVSIRNSSCNGFTNGVKVGRNANNGVIYNSKVTGADQSGILFDDDVTYPDSWTVRDSEIYGNNTGTNTNPWERAGIAARRATNINLINNTFGRTSETQFYSIRLENTATDCRIQGNDTKYLAASGVAYAPGASTDYSMNAMGSNNIAASGITLAGGVPLYTISSTGNKVLYASAAPASGTWTSGDRVWNTSPTASTTTGMGWVYVAAWEPFGDIGT